MEWTRSDRRHFPVTVSLGSFVYFDLLIISRNHNGPNNLQHPYLTAIVNNGSAVYDNDKDGKEQSVGGCELKFRNKDYETLIAIRLVSASFVYHLII